jgi:hypothetical protein
MIHRIFELIDIKEISILGISLASVPIVPMLGIVATLTTIAYNVIRIRKELKNKK